MPNRTVRTFSWSSSVQIALALAVGLGVCAAGAAAEPVRFDTDVMAVLSRAGCNQGACHGNQNGKNGFKLSLRGQDPAWDYLALTHDSFARRISRQRPADSLILLKATGVTPHEGGRRFGVDSLEYRVLAGWIAAGLPRETPGAARPVSLEVTPRERVVFDPAEKIRLRVNVRFSDGSVRDETRLAAFDVSNTLVSVGPQGEVAHDQFGETTILVRYLHLRQAVSLAFVPPHRELPWPPLPTVNYIDEHVFHKLRALHQTPSARCEDAVFLRRAYLDLLGMLPPVEETRQFLSDQGSDKRERLIDHLLQRPEFADFWALKWSDVLRNEEKTLDRKGVQVFHDWIRQALLEGKPLNEFAGELVAARGSTYARPAANFYRALRDPLTRAEAAAQVFLGVRLQCARCHNHPFDQWTQLDYYGWAAFFARVDYRIVQNKRADRLDQHQFDGDQIVWHTRRGEVKNPRTGADMAPKFLGTDTPLLGPDDDRLQVLADWIANPANPFFARAQANRVWYHLMGRGLVEPDDDFRASNPPSNGPLLEALAHDFAATGFDLRHLIRTIMTSTTYQLESTPNAANRDDDNNFAHALVRSPPAEVLFDAMCQAAGTRVGFRDMPPGLRATQLPGVPSPGGGRNPFPGPAEQFLLRFGKPERLLSCDCERSEDVTVGQGFQLITGKIINDLVSRSDNRLSRLLAAGRPGPEAIDECYLAALCRHPSAREQAATASFLKQAPEKRAALEDVLAALLSSKEFLLRR